MGKRPRIAIPPHPNPLPKERGNFSGIAERRMGVAAPEHLGRQVHSRHKSPRAA